MKRNVARLGEATVAWVAPQTKQKKMRRKACSRKEGDEKLCPYPLSSSSSSSSSSSPVGRLSRCSLRSWTLESKNKSLRKAWFELCWFSFNLCFGSAVICSVFFLLLVPMRQLMRGKRCIKKYNYPSVGCNVCNVCWWRRLNTVVGAFGCGWKNNCACINYVVH